MDSVKSLMTKLEGEKQAIEGFITELEHELSDNYISIQRCRNVNYRQRLRLHSRAIVRRKRQFVAHRRILQEQIWNLYDLLMHKNHLDNLTELMAAERRARRSLRRMRQQIDMEAVDDSNERTRGRIYEIHNDLNHL